MPNPSSETEKNWTRVRDIVGPLFVGELEGYADTRSATRQLRCVEAMPEVESGGVRIGYDAVGEGRPLVLLHGWCCDRSWWTEPGYVDELRSDHRLVNVDIRGHGASDKPHEAAAYTADTLTGDVLAVADAQGLDRFASWGQSYGGRIAWRAGRHAC